MVVDGILVEDHENVWFLNMQKDISLLVVVVRVDLQQGGCRALTKFIKDFREGGGGMPSIIYIEQKKVQV